VWLSRLRTLARGPRWPRRPAPTPDRRRPRLEQLEDRALPSSYTASTTAQLIADINAANAAGGNNTITLSANTTFDLTAVNNTANGANGLPVVTRGDALTITGPGGDIVQRDTAAPFFRLFDVASRAALTLSTLTLQNGLATGSGSAADGGAVYNKGSVTLNGVTVQNNSAEGTVTGGKVQDGQPAAGGGIWSSGSLTLQNGTTLMSNGALGGNGGNGDSGGNGGNGLGGGIWSSGSLTLQGGSTPMLQGNNAWGGDGGQGFNGQPFGLPGIGYGGGLYMAAGTATLSYVGIASNNALMNGYGGGLYVGGGTITLYSCTISSNTAQSAGGGIYIASRATVYFDSYTVTNTTNNTAAIDPNIDGTYILT
jgi:hypothetical protein